MHICFGLKNRNIEVVSQWMSRYLIVFFRFRFITNFQISSKKKVQRIQTWWLLDQLDLVYQTNPLTRKVNINKMIIKPTLIRTIWKRHNFGFSTVPFCTPPYYSKRNTLRMLFIKKINQLSTGRTHRTLLSYIIIISDL